MTPDDFEEIDEIMRNREIARKLASDAASRGESIPGMLAELENLAAPFFLGVESDPDDSDMDVWP